MEYFAGLDVATEETAICLIDGAGSIVLEATVATEPEAICKALRKHLPRLRRVGHEAGSLSPWLQTELTNLGLPAVCLEARGAHAALAAQRNKTAAPTRAGSLTSCARAGSGRSMSRAGTAIGCGFCSTSAAISSASSSTSRTRSGTPSRRSN